VDTEEAVVVAVVDVVVEAVASLVVVAGVVAVVYGVVVVVAGDVAVFMDGPGDSLSLVHTTSNSATNTTTSTAMRIAVFKPWNKAFTVFTSYSLSSTKPINPPRLIRGKHLQSAGTLIQESINMHKFTL